MNGRDAAQMRERKIERFARRIENRHDRNPFEIGVGNNSDRVAKVKLPCLLWNVAGGKVLAEKTFEVRLFGFAHHLPGAVMHQLVDHRTVIVEQTLYQARRDL